VVRQEVLHPLSVVAMVRIHPAFSCRFCILMDVGRGRGAPPS
jgi:hypothetical protein